MKKEVDMFNAFMVDLSKQDLIDSILKHKKELIVCKKQLSDLIEFASNNIINLINERDYATEDDKDWIKNILFYYASVSANIISSEYSLDYKRVYSALIH